MALGKRMESSFTSKLLIFSLITILINQPVSSVFGSAVLETEEFTLAIVNVTGVGAFTGFASNFRNEVPGHTFGKVASLTGVLIRAESPISDGNQVESSENTNLDTESTTINYRTVYSREKEGKIGGAKVNYSDNQNSLQLSKETKEMLIRERMAVFDRVDSVGRKSVDRKEEVNQGKSTTTNDACTPIKLDWIPQRQWILLVQYGNCPDEIKLKHISQTNASAVLIYDNVPGHRLIKFDPPSKLSINYLSCN